MQNHIQQSPACKSVFKSGENTITTTQFTQKWVELINKLEESKRICAGG